MAGRGCRTQPLRKRVDPRCTVARGADDRAGSVADQQRHLPAIDNGNGDRRYPRPRLQAVGGNTTSFGPDADGNITRITPPRGYAANTNAYDITQTFDAAGNLLTKQLPVEAGIGKPFAYTYDNWSNLTAVRDPDGNYAVTQYDDLNRPSHQVTTRGPWPSDTSEVPAGCRQTTSSDAPIPAGRILCSTTTTYDSVNNPVSITDASGQTTQFIYDAFQRKTQQLAPRHEGS